MAKVKHIVLLKFKEEITQEQIDSAFERILDCTENVDGIEDYVEGPGNSPEGLSQEFTHGFVMTFHDVPARDAYLRHPEHLRIKQILDGSAASVLVFDFEV